VSGSEELLRRLAKCPPGRAHWKEFEDSCLAILEYLFVPPLNKPKIQARSLSGIDRPDAVFPNRQFNTGNSWEHLLRELDARMILFEFKNYGTSKIGKKDVDQASNYLKTPMGRLAILCSNKPPSRAACVRRNGIYSSQRKVVLFLTPDHLKEMCIIKERGEDPADLILDLVEEFYLRYE